MFNRDYLDEPEKYGLVKEHFKNLESGYEEKTHVRLKEQNYMDRGITGFYTPKELVEYYGDCQCERVYYEKDYGCDEYNRPCIAIRDFLVVYADKDFHSEIMATRKKNRVLI